MSKQKPPPLSSDTMTAILRDIATSRAPEDSQLKYTAAMLKWRAEATARFEAFSKKHPGATLEIPQGIDGLPGDDD